ncbi:MAG: PLP-dependent aspartate aminotransferase family protein [Desulfobacterales bacterium]|nr:PLP-dependent aspartate aminotransferase family protein [Desulfobacterales bacterium]
MHTDTQCVHSGSYFEATTGGINTPIFTSSAYDYLNREDPPYPRYFNTVNQDVVVKKVCALEAAEDGVLFSSGMAAMSTAILAFAGSGDHVVLMDELYGGTHAFVTDAFEHLGIDYTFAQTSVAAITAAVTDRTRVVVIESPTNPLLGVVDIAGVAEMARARGITTIIDNTFASPINQKPATMGIDIVVHSGTKYMGGHSDLCCGIAVTTGDKAQTIRHMARHLGGSLNAMTCYLLERSLKTLALRVRQQTANAGRMAAFLAASPAVTEVFYPGLEETPGHAIARTQMTGFGAMLSFELDAAKVSTDTFLRSLALIRPAVSLGGVETTICAPAKTSHVKMSPEERKRIGVNDELLRLSVGIEDAEDLIGDIQGALEQATLSSG